MWVDFRKFQKVSCHGDASRHAQSKHSSVPEIIGYLAMHIGRPQ